MKCAFCDWEQETGKFCDRCGLALASAERAPGEDAPLPDEPEAYRCPLCGVVSRAPRCPGCGIPLGPREFL